MTDEINNQLLSYEWKENKCYLLKDLMKLYNKSFNSSTFKTLQKVQNYCSVIKGIDYDILWTYEKYQFVRMNDLFKSCSHIVIIYEQGIEKFIKFFDSLK